VSLAAMEWSLKGPHENAASAETASGIALVEAFDQIRSGHAALIAAGGSDALSATSQRAHRASGATAPLGEGAAVLVLESEVSAAERGVAPLGKLLGCGLAVTPHAAAMAALAQAGIAPDGLTAIYANAAARNAAAALSARVTVHAPENLCGDVQGATSVLHTAFALIAKHEGPVLILTADVNTCVACVAVRL